jgi:hypothetical protein
MLRKMQNDLLAPGRVMFLSAVALVVTWSVLASSVKYCFAQDEDNFEADAITSEQWQQRVANARIRSEQFVGNARMHIADPGQTDPPNSTVIDIEAADQQAMNDPSLRRGDTIATSKGFFVFVGRDGEGRLADFLPAQNPKGPK